MLSTAALLQLANSRIALDFLGRRHISTSGLVQRSAQRHRIGHFGDDISWLARERIALDDAHI